MITRYDIPVISNIWNTKTKYTYFLQVEQALLKALEEEKIIPVGVSESLNHVEIRLERIDELDLVHKHDVIAFCTSITEQMPREFAPYFHFGVTSSDIIDTALMLQIRDSMKLMIEACESVIHELCEQIEKSKHILGLGRSHGIYAEPMIFAGKWLGHLSEFQRRLKDFKSHTYCGQFSGAVGNYSLLTPEIEKKALGYLHLKTDGSSTQVIARDHIAKFTASFSLLSVAIERLAIEIRHLHHSDINEVCEGFSAHQKGSSTMPHKKNPISSENLSGLARMMRSYHQVALENCLLWHERDISHSSCERLYLPDMFGIAYYSLKRLAGTLNSLTYNEENITRKIEENPQVLSSLILHELILKTELSREELYKIVQKVCFEASSLDSMKDEIKSLTGATLEKLNLHELKRHYHEQFAKVLKQVTQGD